MELFSDPLIRQVSVFVFFLPLVPCLLPSLPRIGSFNWSKGATRELVVGRNSPSVDPPLFCFFSFFAFWKVEANVSLPPCNQWCSNDPRRTVVSWRYSSAFLQYLFFLSFFFGFLFLQKEKQRSHVTLSSALENYGLGRFFVCFWSFFVCVCVVAVLYSALPCGNVCSCENMKLRFFSTHTDKHTYTQTAISSFLLLLFCVVLTFCPFNWIWRRVWTIIVKNFVFPFFVCNPNRAFRVVFKLVFFFFFNHCSFSWATVQLIPLTPLFSS